MKIKKTSSNLPFWPDPSNYGVIDFNLERVHKLLNRIGNPHLKLPPTIHLAGTNGKGSTLSFLRAIFEESGLKIHTYTSPHLVKFNERIVLAGEEISDDFLNECLNECKKAAEKNPKISVTFFEGTTIAAFLAFSRVKADLLLLETGMGGRLDATNVLPKVLCSVITPISLDHTEFLGKTLGKIAAEKAGIIKKNCPVIIGKQKKSALKIIEKQALKMDSKIIHQLPKTNYQLSLLGNYQRDNATLAITAALAQKKFKITKKQIENGLKKAFWPARLQKINSGKFFKILPKNFDLILDGSHNLQGAETVLKFLTSRLRCAALDDRPRIFVIFSMLKDKNCEGFLKKIAPQIDQLITLTIPDEPKSRTALEISQIAKKLKIKSIAAENFDAAFSMITKEKKPALALVCGSLYLAGKFLEENQ